MRVPCFKNHDLAGKNTHPIIVHFVTRWVNIYNDICDSCDICKDSSCRFYDDTREGTKKFLEGSHYSNGTIQGILEEEGKKKAYMELYASETI